MFRLFKKKKDVIDLEQVIHDIAEYNKDEDFNKLYEILIDRELFLPTIKQTIPNHLVPDEKFITNSCDEILMSKVDGPDGKALIPVATTENSPIISDEYLRIDWFEFLEMVLKVEDVFGALIQGTTSWIIIDKERIEYILVNFKNKSISH